MRIKLPIAARDALTAATTIPGWPDAGHLARTFYVLPLVVPFFALAALALWVRLVHEPVVNEVRLDCRPALQLEAEIETLRLECSEEQAAASAAQGSRLGVGLIRTPEETAARLVAMQTVATARGWSATLHVNDTVAAAPGSVLAHRTLRGRLVPVPANAAPFRSLLQLLEEILPPESHGGVTRLTVRADEQGHITAELGARLAVQSPDAQTP